MADKINYQWRVTKYNPEYRDENGSYTLFEDWTCPSEIGKKIDGKDFTLDDYLHVETAYIETVLKFVAANEPGPLRMMHVSNVIIPLEDKSSELYEAEFDGVELIEDGIVPTSEIRTICKMILRNIASCQLFAGNHFFVHFGWDYYMYIGASSESPTAIEFAGENGLFVESFPSPYRVSEEHAVRTVEWYGIGNGSNLLVGEEEIRGVPLDAYRKLFNLSSAHPVMGAFEITAEQEWFFGELLENGMDFKKYEYVLWCGN